MARRRISEQPTSRLAIWARRIALFSLAATLIAIIIVRSGALEIVPALSTLAGALALALVAILLAFGAGISIWNDGVGGIREAVTALLLGLALIAYPLYIGVKAYRLPAIYDVTTDPIDPPRFEAIARLRPRDANPVTYAGLYTAEQQRIAYSDIEPDLTTASPQEAYDAVLKVIGKRKWHVVDARPPQAAAPRDGLVEAIARTPILGFRDDVVVRVRATQEGARIDVRSASRYGRHDLGTNAERVRALIDEVDDRFGRAGAGKEAAARRPKPAQAGGQGQFGQTVSAADRRRALGRDHAARDQVFQMGQYRQRSRAGEPRIEPDIDRPHQRRDVGRAFAEPPQDRFLATLPVTDIALHEARRVAHRSAVAGEVDRLAPPRQLFQRGHVVAHGAVGRRDDRGRPRHHVVAGKDQVGFLERIGHVVRGVSRGRQRLDGPAVAGYDRAVGERDVGAEVHVAAGVEPAGLADMQRPRRRGAGPRRTQSRRSPP